MPTRKRTKNPVLPPVGTRPVIVGNEAMLNSLPPPRALPMINEPAIAPNTPLPIPTYDRTIVGAESTASRGTLDDLIARQNATYQAADQYPSSKVTYTPEGYEIAPPLPPGQHPSRFKAFLRGLGMGAEAGAPYGIGGIAGGAIRGGLTGAISPDTVNREAKLRDVDKLTGRIGTQLGIQKEQAGIYRSQTQSARDLAEARNVALYPNTRARQIDLPDGSKGQIEQDPSQPGGWGIIKVGPNGVSAVGRPDPLYPTDIGGRTVNLTGAQVATATNAQATREATEIERAYQHQKDTADRQRDAAIAASEAGSIDEAINLNTSAASIYRNNARTSNEEATRLQQELDQKMVGEGWKTDSAEYQVAKDAINAAQKRASDFDKAATDAEKDLGNLKIQGGKARGRFNGNKRPILNPSKSGLFER